MYFFKHILKLYFLEYFPELYQVGSRDDMFGVDCFSSLNIPGILMALLGALLYSVARTGKGVRRAGSAGLMSR
jgi:hypothetical protein